MLKYLNLYGKDAKIVLLGLDNAGKTSLLHLLRYGTFSQVCPTNFPQSDLLEMGGIRFRTFDLGGHKTARMIWKDYLAEVDGLVYLVDSTDTERLALSKHELDRVLEDEEMNEVPVLILGNKIDIDGAVCEDELRELFCVGGDQEGRVQLFMCSVAKKFGYAEGFQWLGKQVNK